MSAQALCRIQLRVLPRSAAIGDHLISARIAKTLQRCETLIEGPDCTGILHPFIQNQSGRLQQLPAMESVVGNGGIELGKLLVC